LRSSEKVNILIEENQIWDLENLVTYKSKAHWLQDSWILCINASYESHHTRKPTTSTTGYKVLASRKHNLLEHSFSLTALQMRINAITTPFPSLFQFWHIEANLEIRTYKSQKMRTPHLPLNKNTNHHHTTGQLRTVTSLKQNIWLNQSNLLKILWVQPACAKWRDKHLFAWWLS
jgi:hypothetical protein